MKRNAAWWPIALAVLGWGCKPEQRAPEPSTVAAGDDVRERFGIASYRWLVDHDAGEVRLDLVAADGSAAGTVSLRQGSSSQAGALPGTLDAALSTPDGEGARFTSVSTQGGGSWRIRNRIEAASSALEMRADITDNHEPIHVDYAVPTDGAAPPTLGYAVSSPEGGYYVLEVKTAAGEASATDIETWLSQAGIAPLLASRDAALLVAVVADDAWMRAVAGPAAGQVTVGIHTTVACSDALALVAELGISGVLCAACAGTLPAAATGIGAVLPISACTACYIAVGAVAAQIIACLIAEAVSCDPEDCLPGAGECPAGTKGRCDETDGHGCICECDVAACKAECASMGLCYVENACLNENTCLCVHREATAFSCANLCNVKQPCSTGSCGADGNCACTPNECWLDEHCEPGQTCHVPSCDCVREVGCVGDAIDGCGDVGVPGRDLDAVALAYDPATGSLDVTITLCDAWSMSVGPEYGSVWADFGGTDGLVTLQGGYGAYSGSDMAPWFGVTDGAGTTTWVPCSATSSGPTSITVTAQVGSLDAAALSSQIRFTYTHPDGSILSEDSVSLPGLTCPP